MKKIKTIFTIVIATIMLGTSSVSIAQSADTSNPSYSHTPSSNATYTHDDNRDNNNNWGLLGLVGLIGLAGLVRKNRDIVVRDTERPNMNR